MDHVQSYAPRNARSTSQTAHVRSNQVHPELERLVCKAGQAARTTTLKLPQVEKRISKCKSAIWKDVSEGTFVPPIRIGARAVAWLEYEVEIWLDAMVFNSRSIHPIDIKELVARLVALHQASN